MKLVNTRDRSYNGVRMGEEVELKEQAQIDEYLEAGFEKAGKSEVKGVVSDDEAAAKKAADDQKKSDEAAAKKAAGN